MTVLSRPPLIVIMGVSGCGKTAVGRAVARSLGVPFADADDLHPRSNVEKMSAEHPLDDDDRRPWLDLVGSWLARHEAVGGVIGCSALKRTYRDQLRTHSTRVVFCHLSADRGVIRSRQASRAGHYMPAALLDSQFDDLEPLGRDEAGAVIDVAGSPSSVLDECLLGLLGLPT